MIVGIGMDLVEIDRVAALLERRGERALRRLFSDEEVARCLRADRPAQSYAARFAAKEAFMKAVGTGWGTGVAWRDVEVVSAPGGAPSLRLSGGALRLAEARGVRRSLVSLTHIGGVAGAFVVLED
jgi:holo-[acyl-carrier protein] synthase